MSNQLLLQMQSELQNIKFLKLISKTKEDNNQNSKFFTVIRRATLSDLDKIWDILHCEGQNWSKSHILNNINDLYLLLFEYKLIAVSHCYIMNNALNIKNTVVHPMYPEKSIANSLNNLLLGVVNRQSI